MFCVRVVHVRVDVGRRRRCARARCRDTPRRDGATARIGVEQTKTENARHELRSRRVDRARARVIARWGSSSARC